MTSSEPGVLAGRHAVVTGGGKGIGAAIASALAAEGATLTLMGRTAATIEEHGRTRQETHGTRAFAVTVDVSDPPAVAEAFEKAVADAGAIHILVNNAGQSDAASIQEMTLESWQHMLTVNLTGPFLCIKSALPAMIAARDGRVVNIASTAGLKGYAKVAGYCASKHGLVGLTRALAAETAREGVTIHAVCPGYTDDTDMVRVAIQNYSRASGKSQEDARDVLAKHSPRGSLITLDEVSSTVVWLCSPGASAITGQAIAVAAGEVMR
jgi:NAD(P)-dependent dehydrogenase (short-subunit alcohol dehydrogenase family)